MDEKMEEVSKSKYGITRIHTGVPSECGVSEQDLIDFNILEPLPELCKDGRALIPIGIPDAMPYYGKPIILTTKYGSIERFRKFQIEPTKKLDKAIMCLPKYLQKHNGNST